MSCSFSNPHIKKYIYIPVVVNHELKSLVSTVEKGCKPFTISCCTGTTGRERLIALSPKEFAKFKDLAIVRYIILRCVANTAK